MTVTLTRQLRVALLAALAVGVSAGANASPSIVVLLDQSGGMSQSCGPGTCFTQARDALAATLNTYQSQVNFGLSLFSNDAGTCPLLNTVAPALNNRPAILNQINNAFPSGDKPLADAITASLPLLVGQSGPRAIFAVFISEPDTCAQPNPNEGFPAAIAAATAAYAQGVKTIVVSLGNANSGSLQSLANAGAGLPVGGPANAPFFVAPTAATMNSAFNAAVATTIASALPVPVTPPWVSLSLASLLIAVALVYATARRV